MGKLERGIEDLFTKAGQKGALEAERSRVDKLAGSLLAYDIGVDHAQRKALEKVTELRARRTRQAGAGGPPGQNDLSRFLDPSLSRTGDSEPTIAEAFSGDTSPSGQFQEPDNKPRKIIATPPTF